MLSKVQKEWIKELNCAEITLKLLAEETGFELNGQVLKGAKSLGGGLKSGCVCGALNGTSIFLGIYSEKPIQNTKQFYSDFIKEFGTICCRVLRNTEEKEGLSMDESCPKKIAFCIERVLELNKDETK